MIKRGLGEDIKTRVPRGTKKALVQLAAAEFVSPSVIVRAAVREYLERRQKQETVMTGRENKEAA